MKIVHSRYQTSPASPLPITSTKAQRTSRQPATVHMRFFCFFSTQRSYAIRWHATEWENMKLETGSEWHHADLVTSSLIGEEKLACVTVPRGQRKHRKDKTASVSRETTLCSANTNKDATEWHGLFASVTNLTLITTLRPLSRMMSSVLLAADWSAADRWASSCDDRGNQNGIKDWTASARFDARKAAGEFFAKQRCVTKKWSCQKQFICWLEIPLFEDRGHWMSWYIVSFICWWVNISEHSPKVVQPSYNPDSKCCFSD